MKAFLIILFFIFSMNVYSQSYVSPTHVFKDNTFQSIVKDWENYYPDWWEWSGAIMYYDIVLPGAMRIYFDRNVSYGMDVRGWSEDSTEAWNMFEQYIQFTKDSLGGSGTWSGTMPYYRYGFPGGFVRLDASRIYYTQHQWDGTYYLIYASFTLRSDTVLTWSHRPSNRKPNVILQ